MVNINIPSDDKRTLIKTYLEIVNSLSSNSSASLSEGEINILTEVLLLPEKYSYQRFSRYAKPVVINSLKENYGWTIQMVNYNTKLYDLVNKGYLWRDEDGIIYVKEYLVESTKELLKSKKIIIQFNDSSVNRQDNK